MKGKIFLIDYLGQSDAQGRPVGHAQKTLAETVELLDGLAVTKLVVPRAFAAAFSHPIGLLLNHHCPVGKKNIFLRFACLWKKAGNLARIFRHLKEGTLWFVNIDFMIFVFLFFYPFKIRSRLVVSLYLEGFKGKPGAKNRIKHYFFSRTIARGDLVVKNSRSIAVGANEIFCPDYLYREERYALMMCRKSDYILCAGVMNRAKDVQKLLAVCAAADLRLKLVGLFPDKGLFAAAKRYESDKIAVQDRYLEAGEYYRNIAEARFCILPYKRASYGRRTSGILLESIYLDTPVIAPDFLLDYSGLPGIGYERLEELPGQLKSMDDTKIAEIKRKMKSVREAYDFSKIKETVAAALADLYS